MALQCSDVVLGTKGRYEVKAALPFDAVARVKSGRNQTYSSPKAVQHDESKMSRFPSGMTLATD